MLTKKYTDIDPGTALPTDVTLVADPVTGVLKRVLVSTFVSGGGGGGGDITAPTVVSATAINSTTIRVVFSEIVTLTNLGWSFKKNGSAWSISSLSGSGTDTIDFTMGSSGISTDTITRTYSSTSGDTIDGSSNALVSFSDQPVTNIIAGYDSDALAFFSAAGITDTTQKSAVNQLVLDLKGYSLWTKILALYPFVGGSGTSHKYNLKNPADTNAAYRLNFQGGWTHGATGSKGDGSSAYADTFYKYAQLVFDGTLSINDYHHSMYLRQSYTPSGDDVSMGANGTNGFYFNVFNSSGLHMYSVGCGAGHVDTTVSAYTKFFIQSRTSNTSHKLYQDGSQIGSTDTTASGVSSWSDVPPNDVTIGALGSGSPTTSVVFYAESEFSLVSMGKGLNDTEAANFTTAVNTYQTTLSRNV